MDVAADPRLPVPPDWTTARTKWQDWFLQRAFPLWADQGVDLAQGGFFEKLDTNGKPVEEPRRTRVVARQLYVCAAARRLGWTGDTTPLLTHGLAFLLERLRCPDHHFASSFDVGTGTRNDHFDLYEQAFALFALASVHEVDPVRFADLPKQALATLGCLRDHWQHPLGGFQESLPPTAPLRANPHMHMLEAALQWLRVTGGQEAVWVALADDMASLALDKLLDAPSGMVTEWFDLNWRPLPGERGSEAEPGHQFVWGWLLLNWARARPAHPRCQEALAAARRMIDQGEALGIDPARGVAINAIGTDGQWRDRQAKLWPQTERIKAWTTRAELASSEQEAAQALALATAAIRSLQRYLEHPLSGAWHESMDADGGWQAQDTRASSLYHIVYALETACALRTPRA